MSVESNWKNRSGRRAKMETKKERKKKKEEGKKRGDFVKSWKCFCGTFYWLSPSASARPLLCFLFTQVPFVLSLFPVHSLPDISLDLILPGAAPYSCISIHVCLFYSRLLYLYPFLFVYVSPLLRQQSTWIGRLLLTWKKKKNNQKSQKKKETPGETRRYKEERKRRIHIDGITVKMFRKGCWAIAKRIHQTIFRQH